MSVLLRQPHGFEGFRLAHVELLVDDQPVPERIGPRHLPEGHLLSAPVSNPTPSHRARAKYVAEALELQLTIRLE